ncbi:glycoside hydrolase family 3 N-terminal domain-containing protein [Streptomyces formicae]|uniref:Glycoside hydrolase family 3 C-terminal domain-containing protein n=1 Tax=Streptomyces formicae TaxID=1616117 RepID=A0ABY3WLC8_9ACTN|nr:glycoside hydrolase family 3 N-terminal domain-containing protein [Streptomyces formicae]UNM13438.1 glycoside hydrolase family 3 C-terminal domain-containing protein [Streptomyces formicae]
MKEVNGVNGVNGVHVDVGELLSRMTLREKVGQLNQRLFGWDCVARRRGGFELTDAFHAEVERWGGLGALYGLFRADAWSGRSWKDGIRPEERAEVAALVTDAVRSGSRHGVPPLVVEEAPHGHQALGSTLFPVNLNAGASWDPGLLAECARAVAAELRAGGVHLALVSALDLLRDPRWGRAEECFGEDPLLAAELTRALVEGMQGVGRSALATGGVGVVLKHFAAQGEGVGGRNGQSAVLGPRDLHELHLPAAEAGTRAGAVGVMAAYNDIDGVPCCANPELLTGLLRDAWGFDGLVMADGKAVDRLAAMTGSLREAARTALLAGVDLSLWDEAYTLLEEAAEDDPRTAEAIDRACGAVLRVKSVLGLLEADPVRPAVERVHPEAAPVRTAAELSGRLARRSLVLLENRTRTLPLALDAVREIAVIGPNAASATALLGDYVPPLLPEAERSVLDAVRDRLGDRVRVRHVPDDGREFEAATASADLVLAVLGGTSHRHYGDGFADNGAALRTRATCGEGVDLADLRLPGGQDALLRRARAATGAPLVAVVVAGRPHVLTEVLALADATLWAGYPGPYGADAVLDVLLGEAEPEGRLPMTLPADPGAVPVRYNDRRPADGVYVDAPRPVLRAFGYGQGYRTSRVTGLLAHAGEGSAAADRIVVTVELENESARPLPEVVQVYAHRTGGPAWPRVRELVAFRRVVLPPGTVTPVTFALTAERLFSGTREGRHGCTTLFAGELDVRINHHPWDTYDDTV